MKPLHHSVMFLCNDDRGLPTNRVEQIEIADEIRLVWPTERPPVFHVDSKRKRLKIERRYLACLGWTEWVGNIFWNATAMHVVDARQMVRALLENG